MDVLPRSSWVAGQCPSGISSLLPDAHVFWKSSMQKDKTEEIGSSALLPCILQYSSAFCHDSYLLLKSKLVFLEELALPTSQKEIQDMRSDRNCATFLLMPSLISSYLPELLSYACLFCRLQFLVISKPQISKPEYDGGEIMSSRISFSKEPKFLVSPFR